MLNGIFVFIVLLSRLFSVVLQRPACSARCTASVTFSHALLLRFRTSRRFGIPLLRLRGYGLLLH